MGFRRVNGIDCERYRGIELDIWPEHDGRWYYAFQLPGRLVVSDVGYRDKQRCIGTAHALIGEYLRRTTTSANCTGGPDGHGLQTA